MSSIFSAFTIEYTCFSNTLLGGKLKLKNEMKDRKKY